MATTSTPSSTPRRGASSASAGSAGSRRRDITSPRWRLSNQSTGRRSGGQTRWPPLHVQGVGQVKAPPTIAAPRCRPGSARAARSPRLGSRAGCGRRSSSTPSTTHCMKNGASSSEQFEASASPDDLRQRPAKSRSRRAARASATAAVRPQAGSPLGASSSTTPVKCRETSSRLRRRTPLRGIVDLDPAPPHRQRPSGSGPQCRMRQCKLEAGARARRAEPGVELKRRPCAPGRPSSRPPERARTGAASSAESQCSSGSARRPLPGRQARSAVCRIGGARPRGQPQPPTRPGHVTFSRSGRNSQSMSAASPAARRPRRASAARAAACRRQPAPVRPAQR